MKLTNKKNLPQAIVDAVSNDPYTMGKADFSVTGLLKPPRMKALERKHWNELEEDVADRLWALYGQIAHGVLERANELDLVEKRFFAEFDGKVLSGQIDTLSLNGGVLSDFKFTTAWGFKGNQEPKIEWVQQLNMQLELLRQNGKDAKKLQIIGLLRDWSPSQADKDPSYPQCQIMIHEIPMWPREKTQKFIKERIKAHQEARDSLPLCSKEDRWARDDVFAVMKKGRKTAIKLYSSEDQAIAHADQAGSFYVVYRPGQSNRCGRYCSVSKFCSQYLEEINSNEESA